MMYSPDIRWTASVVLLATTLASCSKKLDREKAAELIRSKHSLPSVVSDEISVGTVNFMLNFGGANTTTYKELERAGMITFKSLGKKRDMFFQYVSYKVTLLPEAEQYVTGSRTGEKGTQYRTVRVGDWDLVEVTGIKETEPDQKAQVEYTWRYGNITPFGQALSKGNLALNKKDDMNRSRPIYDDGQIQTATASMERYDDGWRITER